jgi:hypothetical protein
MSRTARKEMGRASQASRDKLLCGRIMVCVKSFGLLWKIRGSGRKINQRHDSVARRDNVRLGTYAVYVRGGVYRPLLIYEFIAYPQLGRLIIDRSDHGNGGAYWARAEASTAFCSVVERTTRLASTMEGEGGLMLRKEFTVHGSLQKVFVLHFNLIQLR